jgi:HK97 family phage major capsid protein
MSESIQDLRLRREHLVNESRRLLDENKGARFTPAVAAQVDALHAEIDQLDRRIDGIEFSLRSAVGHAGRGETFKDQSTGTELPVMRGAADFRAFYAQRAEPAERQGGVTLTDFVKGVAGLRSSPAIKNALSIGTDSQGGFTVPSLVMPGILEALTATSSLLQAGAGIVPLEDGAKSYTLAAVSTVPTAAWRSEGAAVAESDPVFRGITITPRSLSFYFKVSRELLADSPDMDPALRTAIAGSMAVALDAAGLRGSGTPPTPRGLLNTSGIQAVTNGANGASLASAIKYANLNSAYQLILEANAPPPTAVIMSPRSLIGYSNLADTTTQPLARPPLLAPLKFVATSAIPNNLTVGTSTDCTEQYVGDFTSCTFFMRQQLSVQLATELFAGNGQVGFIAHMRADFAARYPAAIALATGIRP